MTTLHTFHLPESISATPEDIALGKAMIEVWRRDGIFQVAATPAQNRAMLQAMKASQGFFRLQPRNKARRISDLTYSGYIASGEEVTAGQADYSEIFTVCKDLPLDDVRVKNGWPCHGPVPWPNKNYRLRMHTFMEALGDIGERLLTLVALGLELEDRHTFTDLTRDGWHHLRVLRFPAGSSATARGIGAHTDYGLLVIAAQDDVGGLYIRPPVAGEKRNRNWLEEESSAGRFEDQDPWTFVQPMPRVFTVFPGDLLQFMTDGYLLSTPHKVKLNTRERFALAYFHEPNFEAIARPVWGQTRGSFIHYGEHFTRMFMRCYPERITTRRILKENRLAHLELMKRHAGSAPVTT